MEKTIGYTIAAYFGNRATSHPKYKEDELFYIKTQLEQLDKLSTKLHKIYIICTFATGSTVKYTWSVMEYLRSYLLVNPRSNVVVLNRENIGGSYCSWEYALDHDKGECNYMVLVEDDYTIYDESSITNLVEYFSEEPNLFYLSQMWTDKPHTTKSGITVPNHAAISNGVINNKLYHESKEKGLGLKLRYDPATYDCMWENQALFLEPYRKNGYLIKDYRDKYKSTFCIAQDTETVQGNPSGTEIFVPIVKSKF